MITSALELQTLIHDPNAFSCHVPQGLMKINNLSTDSGGLALTCFAFSLLDNYNNLVAFNEHGDGIGQYLIYNFARDLYSGEYQYRLVGDYKNSKLSMRFRPIWPGGQSKLVPSSQCSEECPWVAYCIYFATFSLTWMLQTPKTSHYYGRCLL